MCRDYADVTADKLLNAVAFVRTVRSQNKRGGWFDFS
jgi:hypothetical protein